MRKSYVAALLALMLPSAGPAQSAGAFRVNGAGYATLADAVAAIGDGEGVIVIAPGRYTMCAVQSAGAISYRATVPGRVVFAGATCEDKAALVLRGRSATVDGIVFEGLTVADGNGAGIRLEQGDLIVRNSMFRDSQEGILTAPSATSSLTIEQSTFTRLGACRNDGGCSHSTYVGRIARLTVVRCRFEEGRGGHYLKSRAVRSDIVANSFDDSGGRDTNYMIDLPNGATGSIRDNEMVQGRDKDNYSAFIALAAEGVEHPSDGLQITDNAARFVPGLLRKSAFLANWSDAEVVLRDNRLGPGIIPVDRR